MKRLVFVFLLLISLCFYNCTSHAAYPTTTEHHKRYPYTSVMASPYSCDPTGAVDIAASLEQIKANQSNIGTIHFPAGTYKLSTTFTLPAGMTFRFETGSTLAISADVTITGKLNMLSGGLITIATTKTLTINGPLEAGIYQIFSCTGTGKVVFGTGSVKEVYPEWWGAKADGATNCTAAINAAVIAHPVVCLSAGIYLISGEIVVAGGVPLANTDGNKIYGQGMFVTTIMQGTTTAKVFNNTSQLTVKDLLIDYSSTPGDGAVAFYSGDGSPNSVFQNIFIKKCAIGFECTVTSSIRMENVHVYGYKTNAFYFHDLVLDIFVTHFTANAVYVDGSGDWKTLGSLGGIRIFNEAEGVVFTEGDVMGGVYSLHMDAAVFTRGVCPAFCNFTNVFFDGSYSGSVVNHTMMTEFVGCWFSWVGRGLYTGTGLVVNTSDSLRFTNSRFYTAGKTGCILAATSKRTQFVNCIFVANGIFEPGYGLYVSADTTDFSVIGSIACNDLPPHAAGGDQLYGIIVGAGTSDRYIISDNNLYNNTTDGLWDGGTGANKRLSNNIGYLPGAYLAPAVPASTVEAQNTKGFPVMVTVTGGTVTVIATGAVSGALTATGLIVGKLVLPAGWYIAITHSAPPTWAWEGIQ